MNKNNKKSNRFDLALISSVEASPQYGSTPEEGGKIVLMRNPIYISKNIGFLRFPRLNSERFSWKIVLSVSQHSHIRKVLHFSSKDSRATFLDLLFSKWLFSTLSQEELEIFLMHKESTDKDIFYSALRAVSEGIPKSVVYKRLKSLYTFLGKELTYTAQRYKALQGKVLVFLHERKEELSISQKYRAYCKGPVDQGTLRSNSIVAELLEPEYFDDKNGFSHYTYLSLPVSEWSTQGDVLRLTIQSDDETGYSNKNF